MRPRRLELEGFVAFRQPTVVDFAGADLFALVGPTGAGKTSLLDAITFALYGSIPRLDDRRAVAPVISQNLTEARLRLDFDVGPDSYTAVRVVRATKAGATTREARLQRGDTVLAGTADEVTTAVTDLLGLSYDHFTTCVSLPQGQFARFLHDKPRDRQDLLVRLLELGLYDKVAGAARQRGTLAAGQIDVLEGQLERLSDATPERLAEAQAHVGRLAALADSLTVVRPEIDRLAEEERIASADVERLDRQLGALRALRLPEGVAELSALLASVDEERAATTEAEAAAVAALSEVEGHLAGLPSRSEVERVQHDLARVDQLRELFAKGAAAAADATAAVRQLEGIEADAEAERDRCARALEDLRVEHRAQALVPELRVGEPCPVCRQTLTTLPGEHPDHSSVAPEAPHVAERLRAAERALADAEARLKAVAREVGDARTHEARVDEKVARVHQEAAETRARLREALAPDGSVASALAKFSPVMAAAGSPLVTTSPESASGPAEEAPQATQAELWPETVEAEPPVALSDVEALLEDVDAAQQAVDRARQNDRAAREAHLAAHRRGDQLRARETEARRAFDQARDALVALDPPQPDRRDLAHDWALLLAWADDRRPALDDELAQSRGAAATARRRATDRLGELVTACRDAGVTVEAAAGGQPLWPGEAVAAAHARADEEVQRIETALAEAEQVRRRARELTEQRQVAETLAGHLAANRFEKWLLDEAVHRLVSGASTVLAELSSGAYGLSVDRRSGGFAVIDHANASQPRPARTLSGGETFLASLALALALADQVADLAAGGAARLESLFLDEGFGTLDADTLDVVATAIDELGARGRLVGVVTHVRELAERLPVRFEVRKVGGTSTVERVDT